MWASVTIKVVDAGTEFPTDDGAKHIVTDTNAVCEGRVMYVTDRINQALKAAASSTCSMPRSPRTRRFPAHNTPLLMKR